MLKDTEKQIHLLREKNQHHRTKLYSQLSRVYLNWEKLNQEYCLKNLEVCGFCSPCQRFFFYHTFIFGIGLLKYS